MLKKSLLMLLLVSVQIMACYASSETDVNLCSLQTGISAQHDNHFLNCDNFLFDEENTDDLKEDAVAHFILFHSVYSNNFSFASVYKINLRNNISATNSIAQVPLYILKCSMTC